MGWEQKDEKGLDSVGIVRIERVPGRLVVGLVVCLLHNSAVGWDSCDVVLIGFYEQMISYVED